MSDVPKNRVVFLVTGNLHKFNEARRVLSRYKIATAMLKKVEAIEMQDDSIEKVAEASVLDAAEKCNLPVLVEDAGMFIDALNGFPGPYASYVYRTIGNDGVLKLMEGVANRRAAFKSAIAFACPGTDKPTLFSCEVEGQIIKQKKGNLGFGFDPVFKPSASRKTFAEMSVEEKNKFSHRASALRKFAQWYTASF